MNEPFTYEQLVGMSELIADAIIKKTMPVKDEITQREAERLYGVRWLLRQKEDGKVTPVTRGNCFIYSRHELDCLKASEKGLRGVCRCKSSEVTNLFPKIL